MRAAIINQLIDTGCPSIAYRIRKEIRKDTLTEDEIEEYQRRIQADIKIQRVLAWQAADGYFGTRLHTAPSRSNIWPHEGCVRYLLEKGLTKEFKPLGRALTVLLHDGWGREAENSKAAQIFKYEMIRASLFAQAGLYEQEFVSQWVDDALQGFAYLAEAKNYMDLVKTGPEGKLIFKEGKYLPVIYHLRLLAYTHSWRTKENLEMMAKAYSNLYRWLPLPPGYYKAKSHPVAPLGNVDWPVNQNFSREGSIFWFQFYELSARMGMLGSQSPFRRHFEELKERCEKTEGWFTESGIKKDMYINWSAYTGFALDGDWEDKQQRARDFTFRILLIDNLINDYL